MKKLLCAAAILLISGCTTISKNEEIARKTELYRTIIAPYGDQCQPYAE